MVTGGPLAWLKAPGFYPAATPAGACLVRARTQRVALVGVGGRDVAARRVHAGAGRRRQCVDAVAAVVRGLVVGDGRAAVRRVEVDAARDRQAARVEGAVRAGAVVLGGVVADGQHAA